jgi:tellurium resistance protein TerD
MGLQLGGTPQPTVQLGGGFNLEKGEKFDLTKRNPGLKVVRAGLGWDVNNGSGEEFDLDAVAFLLDKNGKLVNEKGFVYYRNMKSLDGAVQLDEDNRTGAGEGDDEKIFVHLANVSPDVDRIRFGVSIYLAESRQQNFGQVNNAYIRLVNEETGEVLCRYDLTEEHSTATYIEVGDLYRYNGEWKFAPTEKSSKQNLNTVASSYL